MNDRGFQGARTPNSRPALRPLAPDEADAAYAKVTNWCLFVSPTEGHAFLLDRKTNPTSNLLLTMTFVAHKDPMPA